MTISLISWIHLYHLTNSFWIIFFRSSTWAGFFILQSIQLGHLISSFPISGLKCIHFENGKTAHIKMEKKTVPNSIFNYFVFIWNNYVAVGITGLHCCPYLEKARYLFKRHYTLAVMAEEEKLWQSLFQTAFGVLR